MRIGIISAGLWRSVHLDMAKALQRRGHEVIVYTEDARIPTVTSFTRLIEDGVVILGIHHERRNPWLWAVDKAFKPLLGRRFFTTAFALFRYIRVSRCDIYVVEGDWLGVFLALLRYLIPFRWIVSVHDHEYMGVLLGYPGEPSSSWREVLKRWVLRRADGVRSNSWVTRDVLVKGGIAAERITVVPLHYTERMLVPGDLLVFRAEARHEILARHQLSPDCELLVAACRLTPFKGLDMAVQAMASVLRERPRARLLICGGDRRIPGLGSYRAHLEGIAKESGTGAEVIFTGNVAPADIKRYYAAADLHLVPSYIDTFNYSVLEAALTGTRSVMTDLVGSGYWLNKVGAALVVKGRDPADFSRAIIRGLQEGPGQSGAMGVAARTQQEFRASHLSAEIEAMLGRFVAVGDGR